MEHELRIAVHVLNPHGQSRCSRSLRECDVVPGFLILLPRETVLDGMAVEREQYRVNRVYAILV